MLSFETCNKAIKKVVLSTSQVFIAILSSVMDFKAAKETELLQWLRTQKVVFSVNKNFLSYNSGFCR